MRRLLFLAFGTLLGLGLSGCGTLVNDLQEAESSYDEARYDDAEVWLADIGTNVAKLDQEHRARFYYVRGMTAYRLGHRNDALHYLALAREESGESEAASHLPTEKRHIMDRTLAELTPHTATHHANAAGAEESDSEPASEGEPADE